MAQRLRSWLCWTALALPAPLWSQGQGTPDLARQVTIYRDSYGVPHAFGRTDAAAVFGFAYAQAEDNFPRLEDDYIRSIGREAEVGGPDEVQGDWLNHLLRIPALARAEYRRLPPNVRALVDAFAAGVNYYLARHPEVHPRLLKRIEPWYPLAFIRYNYYQNGFFYASGIRRSDVAVALRFPSPDEQATLGSNGWVIGPSRSASGHVLLFINPHLPFFGPGQVYEGQVHSETGWNFTGYTRFGFPFPYVGHNDALGWVSTDNAADQADLYFESFDDPRDSLAYRYGTRHRRARIWRDSIRVKTDSGLVRRVFVFRATHHGPIVGTRDGRPLALRMAKFEGDGWLAEWYAMTRARNLAQFKQAITPLNMLFGNIMYGDRDGNTFYLYNGAVPRRNPQFDWLDPVEGSDTATEWHGYHPIAELPQLTNPPSGWMQNCNTSPFLLTDVGNPDSTRYPRYMVVEGDNWRGLASRKILAANSQFTWDDWLRAAFDTRIAAADSLLPGLFQEFSELTQRDSGAATRIEPAIKVLAQWDHRADTLSVATTLFDAWRDAYEEETQRHPGGSGNGLAALDSALARLGAVWGKGGWQVPWGEVNRLQRVSDVGERRLGFADSLPSVAVPAVSGGDGAVFTVYGTAVAGQKRRYGVAGGTYISVVEFGPTTRALAVHVFGTSGDPASRHYFDQAPLYARGAMRPSWLDLKEIQDPAHLERAYHPGQ